MKPIFQKTALIILFLSLFQSTRAQVVAKAPTNVGSVSFTANWEKDDSASYYLIQLYRDFYDKNYALVKSDSLIFQTSVNSDSTKYHFDRLDFNTQYKYRLTAYNNEGDPQTPSKHVVVKTLEPLNNLFLISAIRTVAGEKPENEFFDILFNFHFGKRWMLMASVDIALSNVNSDSTRSDQKELTDASAILFWKPKTNARYRVFAAGAGLKVFNGFTYWGIYGGNFELGASSMHSSFINFGYLKMLREFSDAENQIRFDNNQARLFRDNLYVEFAFHNDNFPIIKHTRIKGGILIPSPWTAGSPTAEDRLTARIVIEVPIGGVKKFK